MDEQEKARLVGLSERTLTNYFIKPMNTTAIKDKLQFRIVNGQKNASTGAVTNGLDSLGVALATGHYDVGGVTFNSSKDLTTLDIHRHNPRFLHSAGYKSAHVVLDDMTAEEVAAGGVNPYKNGNFDTNCLVKMESMDDELSIRYIKESLRLNPRYVSQVTIISDDEAMFDGQMSMAYLSPYHHENTRDIDLTEHYSVNQYRDTKITIPFQPGEMQWNDNLLWILKGIPAGATVTVFVEFYDE